MGSTQQAVAALRATTFVVAIFAALVAGQLYNVIKSGEVARAWRSFIVGALVFAVWALASFANTFFPMVFEEGSTIGLVMDLLQTLFILLFAAGLWMQRQMFYHPSRFRVALRPVGPDEGGGHDHDQDEPEEPSEPIQEVA